MTYTKIRGSGPADDSRRMDGSERYLRLSNSMESADRSRIVFDAFYGHPAKGPRELRCWVTSDRENSVTTRIEGPAGRLAENKEMLLSILANVRLIKGAIGVGASPALPLVPYRLRDGSAFFSLPQGWQVQDLGKTQFISVDPDGRFSYNPKSRGRYP